MTLQSHPPIRLPRGMFYGWVIVAVSFMGNWITAPLNPVVFSIFIVPIRDEFHVTLGAMALCTSLRQAAAGISAPFLGHMVDRYGPRWLGVGCAAWAGLTLAAASFTHDIWWMYVCCFLSGFSGFGVFGGGQILTGVPPANWFVAKRGRAMSFATMGGGLGTASWVMISSWLVGWIGWRQSWLIFGVLIAVVLIPAYAFLMRRRPEDVGLHPDGAATAPIEAAVPRPGSAVTHQTTETNFTLREAMRTPALWLLVVAFMIYTFATNSILFLRVPYWTDLGVPTGWIGLGVATDPFVVMACTLIFGYLAERYSLALLNVIGGLARAVSMMPMLVTSANAAWVFAHSFSWGIGSAGMVTGQNLAIPAYFGRRSQGAIRGFTAPIQIGAGAISPPLVGLLIDHGLVTQRATFVIAGALMLLAGLIYVVIRPPSLPAER